MGMREQQTWLQQGRLRRIAAKTQKGNDSIV